MRFMGFNGDLWYLLWDFNGFPWRFTKETWEYSWNIQFYIPDGIPDGTFFKGEPLGLIGRMGYYHMLLVIKLGV